MTIENDGMMEMLSIGATLQGGKYRVERYLASGGFGNTYLAQDANFNAKVVIKEFFLKGITGRNGDGVTVMLEVNRPLFDSQLNKFTTEARRLRGLNHVNIVRVYDLFQENGTAYYVMDFIDGESMASRVKRNGAMSEVEVRAFLPQLLDALETVHGQNILHLDLKPGNIMVDRAGQLRLIDFGASKQMTSDGTATTTTGLAYTPGFAPPEQKDGKLDRVGSWTDLYSFGATLYYLLTAQTPPDPNDIYDSPDEAFRFPEAVSPAMCDFVKWLMQPRYKKRPQTVAEVRQHLPGKPVVRGDYPTRPAPYPSPQYNDFPTEYAPPMSDSGGRTFVVNGVQFHMVLVEGGTFDMGATREQMNPEHDEKPVHNVMLSDYMIGQTQVTQGLWQVVMGSNPSKFKGARFPVENVSWNDCQNFINRLNEITGEHFRLPTEAEWEFAARGGNKSRHTQYSGSDNLDDVAWYAGNSGGATHAVCSKAPNELGIYDMSGNVWEWCQDWYGEYPSDIENNPNGPSSASYRVNRGGCWSNDSKNCRVANRDFAPNHGNSFLGFRLALDNLRIL